MSTIQNLQSFGKTGSPPPSPPCPRAPLAGGCRCPPSPAPLAPTTAPGAPPLPSRDPEWGFVSAPRKWRLGPWRPPPRRRPAAPGPSSRSPDRGPCAAPCPVLDPAAARLPPVTSPRPRYAAPRPAPLLAGATPGPGLGERRPLAPGAVSEQLLRASRRRCGCGPVICHRAAVQFSLLA